MPIVIEYNLIIDFYNSSEIPVVFRNIEFEFIGDFQIVKKNPQTIREVKVLGDDFYKQNIIIDLPPKKMIRINFGGSLYEKEDFINIFESKELFLIGERHDGKTIRYKLVDLDI